MISEASTKWELFRLIIKKVPSKAIWNVELMHEYFPKQVRMGKIKTKKDQETEEVGQEEWSEYDKKQRKHEKMSQNTQTIAWAYRSPLGVATGVPKAVDELPSFTLITHLLPPGGSYEL